jgi:hypothetical protein
MPRPLSFERLFLDHYPVIGPVCRRRSSGVLVVAVDLGHGALIAMTHLRSRPTGPEAVVVGRHPCAGVRLYHRESSLRHLLVIAEPPAVDRRHAEARFRVIDLRTGIGFHCEYGLQLESVTATGPVVLRCGEYAIMLLPTGDPTDWPDDPRDAWELVPPRIFLDERSWGADSPTPIPIYPPPPASARRTTQLIAAQGPALLTEPSLRAAGDPVRGVLDIRQGGDALRFELGAEMLSRGVLVGRYDRCDTGSWLCQPLVSRVHALVVEVAGEVYLIDLASTNGVLARPGDERSRVGLAPIRSSAAFGIGGAGVTLSWTPDARRTGSRPPVKRSQRLTDSQL